MGYVVTPFVLVFILTAIVSSCVAIIAWLRRKSPGSLALFFLMMAIVEWSLAAGIEAAAVGETAKVLWSKIEYLGAYTSPVFLLIFAVQYTRRDKWLNRRNLLFLFILPVTTIVLAATNEWHRLIWSGFSPGLQGSNLMIYHHGPWFWIAIVSVYAYVFYATYTLFRQAFHSAGIYRQQAVALIIACIAPWIGTSMYIFNLTPLPGLDTSPIGFLITGVVLTWSVYRFQFLDMVPVAWEALFSKMKDGVLIVDSQNRVADINPAAKKLLNRDDTSIGTNAIDCLASQIDLSPSELARADTIIEVALKSTEACTVEIQITSLKDRRGNFICNLIILRDISKTRQAESALQEAVSHLQEQDTEIKCLQDQLREEAIRDLLTGLFNRRYLVESLGRELLRAQREDYPVSLLMLDVDHFNQINDNYGQSAGDTILKALSKFLTQKTRGSDIACRYGGDEFMLVLPGANLKTARKRGEEWRTDFEAMRIKFQDFELCATISVGVAVYPLHGVNSGEMLHAVDLALNEARSAGGNCVRVQE
jgi:diguanylate cyclase (GGDEF)-like protein